MQEQVSAPTVHSTGSGGIAEPPLCVDLDGSLVKLATENAAKAGVADKAQFRVMDLFDADLSPATVVTFYLLPEVNMMLRPRLLKLLKPGTRLVAHDYDLGDWRPDKSMIVPAPVLPQS